MSRISSTSSRARDPEDLIAIFHCSFHPTRGNIIDWSMKASEDLDLDGVEFSTLPSGLHLVDEDVVHITHQVHHGISVFRRRPTTEAGMRGFRLESLGILVARSSRPRPWRHLASLKELSRKLDEHWTSVSSQYSDPQDTRDWTLLKEWYLRRVFRRIGEEGKWVDWEEELSSECPDHPALHLPHLLRILGPSSLTLYKHVLARRRVLIYTNPCVEPACILARIASDICGEDDRPNVLGIVGINDYDKLNTESWRGNGWIACTTDAIFLEKPSLYDLVIDMTTSRPSRPAFFVSRPAPPSPRGPRHRLQPVRFTFSDVRLWSELERTLRADADEAAAAAAECTSGSGSGSGSATAGAGEHRARWSDGWRMYEDVCIVCAGAWMGGWRGAGSSPWGLAGANSSSSAGAGGGTSTSVGVGGDSGHLKDAIRLEGEDTRIRNVGRGIEGRPVMSVHAPAPSSSTSASSSNNITTTPTSSAAPPRHVRTTLALLRIFHAHSQFLSERLSELLDDAAHGDNADAPTVVLTLRDVMSLELGVLSALDARFLEWLAERNEKSAGRKVVVRRGWKDLLGVLLGLS